MDLENANSSKIGKTLELAAELNAELKERIQIESEEAGRRDVVNGDWVDEGAAAQGIEVDQTEDEEGEPVLVGPINLGYNGVIGDGNENQVSSDETDREAEEIERIENTIEKIREYSQEKRCQIDIQNTRGCMGET